MNALIAASLNGCRPAQQKKPVSGKKCPRCNGHGPAAHHCVGAIGLDLARNLVAPQITTEWPIATFPTRYRPAGCLR